MAIKYFYIFILMTFCWIHDIWASDLDEPKQNVKTYSPFENFPNEIQQHILDHLDFQSIVNYDRVCQSFHYQWNHRTLHIVFDDKIDRLLPLSEEELYHFTQGKFYKNIYYQGHFDSLDFTARIFPVSQTYIKNHYSNLRVYLPSLSKTQLIPQNFTQPIYFVNLNNKVTCINLYEQSSIIFPLNYQKYEKKDFSFLLHMKNISYLIYNYALTVPSYENLCSLINNGLHVQGLKLSYDFSNSFLQNPTLFSEALFHNSTIKKIIIGGRSMNHFSDPFVYNSNNDVVTIKFHKLTTGSDKSFRQKVFNTFQHDEVHRTFMILDNHELEFKLQDDCANLLYIIIYFQTGILDDKTSNIDDLLEMIKPTGFQHEYYSFLREIDLSYNKFNNQHIKDIAEYLKIYKRLKSLNLSDNSFNKHGFETIGDLINHLLDIEKLVLKDNRIDDEMIHILIPCILKNNTLKYLDLSNNQIGNSGAKALYEMLGQKTSILEIYLNNNQCDESWLKKIHLLMIEQKCN